MNKNTKWSYVGYAQSAVWGNSENVRDWYQNVLGWTYERFDTPYATLPEDADIIAFRLQGAFGYFFIHPADQGGPKDAPWIGAFYQSSHEPTTWQVQFDVDDIDRVVRDFERGGLKIILRPTNVFELGNLAILEAQEGWINVWEAKDAPMQPFGEVMPTLVSTPARAELYARVLDWEFENGVFKARNGTTDKRLKTGDITAYFADREPFRDFGAWIPSFQIPSDCKLWEVEKKILGQRGRYVNIEGSDEHSKFFLAPFGHLFGVFDPDDT